MRIQHNISALNAHRNLFGNNSAVGKNLEKLSSGYRINRAGDDAAGLAISEKMRAQITQLETGKKNAEDGISLVQTAEGALTEVHSMLNRIVELGTQAQNGTYTTQNTVSNATNTPITTGTSDLKKMKDEIDALNEEIERIANQTKFNDRNLLNVSSGKITVHVGEGNIGMDNIDISTLTQNLKTLTEYKDGTALVDRAKEAIDTVSTKRSQLGALQNRLEHTINNLGVQVENITSAESRIRDVDMAKEMMSYTKNNILTQASQAMLAQANQQPQGVLQLLQ